MPLMLFFPNPAHAALVKAYIHGHYRINRKTGDRHWVDSYQDKRPERGRTAFAHWQHRLGHFQTYLAEGKQREALHAFHDLDHADSHKLAVQLGVADADQAHDSKKDLMAAVHERIRTKGKAYREQVAAQVKADWERKKATGTAGQQPVKVIRLTGDEFGAGLAGKSLRDAAVSYAKKHFVDAAFENASTGQSIEVTWQSVKHALANANDAEMRVFHALPRILKTARYVESVPDKLGRPDIQAVHRYAVKVLLKDEPLTIGVIVRETKDGHRFYDHFIIKSKNPAGISEAAPPAGVLGDQPTAGLAGNSVDPQTSDDKGDKYTDGNRYYDHVTVEKKNPAGLTGSDDGSGTPGSSPTLPFAGSKHSLGDAPVGSKETPASVARDAAAAAVPSQGEEAAAWTGLTPKLRLSAVMFADADMATGDGRPTARAKRMADGSWADLSESAKRHAMPYVREQIARNKARDAALARPEPRAPQEALGYDPKAVKNTIGGIEFEAVRRDRPIPHWRLHNVATGETYEAGVFPSGSKSKLWAGAADALRRLGPDRFAREFGPNPRALIGATPADRAAIAGAASGPKDGDINADGLIFRDGRWHRDDPAPALDLTSETPDDLKRKNAAEAAKQAADAEAERRAKADQEREPYILSGSSRPVDELEARGQGNLFDATGAMREQVLTALGLKAAAPKPATPKPVPPSSADSSAPVDDLDPSSPNYRYRDTGYVPGSRKEDAANLLRTAKRSGARVRGTAIDWETLEANPREAKEVITKSHLFGAVDWDALKADGMEPAAGFLVDRVYAAVGKEPADDTPQARQDYALGLESLRDRLESCKTPDQVTKVLAEIKDEYEGVSLNAAETAEYADLQARYDAIMAPQRAYEKQRQKLDNARYITMQLMHRAEAKAAPRQRKYTPTAEDRADAQGLRKQYEQDDQALQEFDKANPQYKKEFRTTGDGWSHNVSETVLKAAPLRALQKDLVTRAKVRNATENPLHRAWGQMGERFIGVMNYRGYKGSDAFGKHVANAKGGRITDWSWAEQSPKPGAVKGASEESTRFQLLVADTYERIGGRAVPVDSTAALKEAFKLREVQSGNWVLRDVNSAKFHTEQTARAFADLADLIGVPDQQIAMNGRLALAFGARGKGNAGFGGGARAHYEPVQRVINLTKMGGGGSLAHEWFHAFDNLLGEAMGMAMGKDAFLTEDPSALPAGELRDAFHGLRAALHEGPHRITVNVPYSGEDYRLAQRNVTRDHLPEGMRDYGMPAPAKLIRDAGDVHAATQAVDAFFAKYPPTNRKAQGQLKQWRAIAAAYYGGQEHGGAIRVESGPAMSSFAREATYLDAGKAKSYWSSTRELAARAFQAWTEDRLRDQGRQSDYLSVKADNKWYRSPFGDPKPFPEGEERTRINVAFDRLMTAVSRGDLLAKALLTVDGPRYLFFKAIGAKPTAPDWLLRFPEVDR